ncbi:glycosyltransferase family protein [Sphingobacterium pedocola]|uniref:Sugar transferase n=1 Tax=Sphingobacterium pedocola TaxID=2082722 RepID=A0ABR9TBU8_9SPHI|nr:glycosyltransferase [Sphingobacterium pedocola]MBE8722833.1 sugar transferase [Sphingobacterium pedocola]
MDKLSPIILFVYNRPDHTRRTLDELEKSPLAQSSILYIFSDGARNNAVKAAVDKVRAVINAPRDFKSVHIIEREVNWGLAKNVVDGVTKVIDEHGKAIVLEDDVLLSEHALPYFNRALTWYEDEETVMHIGGYIYELERTHLAEVFFTRYTASQAWATWKRAWDYFEADIDEIIRQFDKKKVNDFTFDHTMNFWRQIQQQKAGKVDSWAVRWYASVFLRGGLALSPNQSLIENIGHDGTGVHSEISEMFATTLRSEPIERFPSEVMESEEGYRALKKYFKDRKGSFAERGVRFIRNKIFHRLTNRRG